VFLTTVIIVRTKASVTWQK